MIGLFQKTKRRIKKCLISVETGRSNDLQYSARGIIIKIYLNNNNNKKKTFSTVYSIRAVQIISDITLFYRLVAVYIFVEHCIRVLYIIIHLYDCFTRISPPQFICLYLYIGK